MAGILVAVLLTGCGGGTESDTAGRTDHVTTSHREPHAKLIRQARLIRSCLFDAGYGRLPDVRPGSESYRGVSPIKAITLGAGRVHEGGFLVTPIGGYTFDVGENPTDALLWIDLETGGPGGSEMSATYAGPVALVSHPYEEGIADPDAYSAERRKVAACVFSVPAAVGHPTRPPN